MRIGRACADADADARSRRGVRPRQSGVAGTVGGGLPRRKGLSRRPRGPLVARAPRGRLLAQALGRGGGAVGATKDPAKFLVSRGGIPGSSGTMPRSLDPGDSQWGATPGRRPFFPEQDSPLGGAAPGGRGSESTGAGEGKSRIRGKSLI